MDQNEDKEATIPNTIPKSVDNDALDNDDIKSLESNAGRSNDNTGQTERDSLSPNLYKQSGNEPNKDTSRWRKLSKNKKFMGGGIIGLFILIFSLVSFFFGSFLGIFQLDHLLSNIEQKSFNREQSALSSRSDTWMRAYMKARLTEINSSKTSTHGDSKDDPLLFKSKSVDTNNPFKDWYRTLRTSNFEQEVFEKNGVTFVSAVYKDSGGTIRYTAGKIQFKGSSDFVMTNDEVTALSDAIKNGGNFNKFDDLLDKQFTVELFNSNKDSRKAIKAFVADNTHWWQVIKRRHVRLDIQNRTGITSWEFFETTRGKVSTKIQDVRNKFIKAALPDDTKVGKVVQCLFGILGVNECKGGEDPSNPEDRSDKLLTDNNPDATTNSNDHKVGESTDSSGKTTDKVVHADGVSMKFIQDIIQKFGGVLNASNWISTIDSITSAITNLSHIKGLVVAYKTAQAVSAFTTLDIMRDQIKTGQVTSEEINANMKMLSNMGANEGYSKVISNQGATASAANSLQNAKDKQEYCSQQYQDKLIDPNNAAEVNNIYHYLCPEKQIGSVTGAASGIDAFFSSSIGQALKKVADTWRAATSNPFVGFIRAVGDGISFIINAVVQPILKITGIQGKINDLLQYMTGKVAELAGIKPIIDNNGSNSPLITGQVVNAAIQGGAATAEMSMRSAGAARTTAQSQAEAVQLVDNYSKATSSQTSIYTKYASLDNPNSFASKTLSSFAQTKSSIISMFSNVLSNIGSIFSAGQYARASSSSAYSAANFAGIDTYDYPAQCINADPLLMTPQNSTNVKDVLGDSVNSQLTWDIVTDSSKFYDFIYSQDKIANSDDPDSIASQIYNCELLDNNVRGGLGALYGYTKDHGLETTDTSSGNPSNIAAPNFIQMWGGSSQAAIDAMVNSQAPFKPNTLVIHFTEGTGEGMELVNFLDSEGAGIQFNIGTTGKIYEFFPLDAMKETANVGYMNSKVIGIEISARDGMDLLNNQTQFNAVVSTVQFLCSYYHFPCSDPKGEITNSSMADAQGLLGHDEVIEPDLSKQHSDPDTKVVGGTLYNICTNRPWTQADRHDASTHAYMLKLRRALGYTSFTTGTANCAPGGSVGL